MHIGQSSWDKGYSLSTLSADIGKSKCGGITFDPNYPFTDLRYGSVVWWSDGKNVAFHIDVTTLEPGWSKDKLEKEPGMEPKPTPGKYRKVKEDKSDQ